MGHHLKVVRCLESLKYAVPGGLEGYLRGFPSVETLGFLLASRVAGLRASRVSEGQKTHPAKIRPDGPPADNQSQGHVWVWVGVQDVRALHERYEAAGARIRNPPNNFEWGLEMQVEDLDGNVLRIGSDREKDPLGVWKDGDGVRWRHLGNQRYERVE